MGGPGGVTGFGRRLPQIYWQWSGLQPMGVPWQVHGTIFLSGFGQETFSGSSRPHSRLRRRLALPTADVGSGPARLRRHWPTALSREPRHRRRCRLHAAAALEPARAGSSGHQQLPAAATAPRRVKHAPTGEDGEDPDDLLTPREAATAIQRIVRGFVARRRAVTNCRMFTYDTRRAVTNASGAWRRRGARGPQAAEALEGAAEGAAGGGGERQH